MSIDELKQILAYNSETGEFTWTDKSPKKVANKRANAKDTLGYVCLKINGKMYETALEEIAWSNNSTWQQDRAKQVLAQMRGVGL